MTDRRRPRFEHRAYGPSWGRWRAVALGCCLSAVACGNSDLRVMVTESRCGLATNFSWTASERLIDPISDADHDLVSIKDPSVVRFDGRWHIYATVANTAGEWSLVYLNFEDWQDAKSAPQYYLDQTPGLEGYHAAPQVFFFEPHDKWYLIFQSQQPQFSTADDLSKPETWSAPENFFRSKPVSAPELWIDYWVICDEEHCYLFFTADNGELYRSQTRIEDFPQGMSDPVVILREPRLDLFEGSATYKLEGADQYLTLIEAIGPTGARYYKAYTAERLDGAWTPLRNSWELPFAGPTNVTFDGDPWSMDISHGELLRAGHDQRMIVEPCEMQLLFQGRAPDSDHEDYSQLPYGLGLLTQGPSDPSIPPLDAAPVLPPEPKPVEPGEDGNLLSNPGFEEGTTGWQVWGGSLSATSDRAHSGTSSGVVSARTETWHGAVRDVLGRALPGSTYEAGVWVSVSGEDEPVSLTLKGVCGAEEQYTGIATGTASADTWTELSALVRIPECDELQELVVYVEGPASGVDLYVDDIYLRE